MILVDDCQLDVELAINALRRGGLPNEILVIHDGEEALDYFAALTARDGFLPALVTLDIKLPKASGLEILRYLKGHPRLKSIPVIMVSGSAEEVDKDASRRYHADGYLVKPLSFSSFMDLAGAWLDPAESEMTTGEVKARSAHLS